MDTHGHRGVKRTARALLALLLCSVLLLDQWGCSAGKIKYTPPPPLDTMHDLGTIGLSPECDQPGLDLHRPMKRTEAMAFGATSWGVAPIKGVDAPWSGNIAETILFLIVAFLVFWVIIPAAIILGATGGAMTGMSDSKYEDIKSGMDEAVGALKIQENLHARFIETAKETAGIDIVMLGIENSTEPSPHVDTVIELCSGDLSFKPEEKGMKPPIAMGITVRLMVRRTSDNYIMHREPIYYWSKFRKIDKWARNDAELFREEMDMFYKKTAENAAGVLFEKARAAAE